MPAACCRELDQRYRLTDKAARCLHDPRDSHKAKHDLLTLVRQRLFAIAQGYEDKNDAATLARDPAFTIMAGKAPESAADLASQPTFSRFENLVTAKDLRRFSDWLLDLYLKTHPGPRKVIVLDMDATDDPTYGRQQLSPGTGSGRPAPFQGTTAVPGDGREPRGFTLFSYQADSWIRPRWIIAKMEYGHLGSNQCSGH